MSASTIRLNPSDVRRARVRERLLLLAGALTYTLLGIVCALGAYWTMFTQFAPYDDAGNFEYALRLFMSGHPLYNSTFSAFGPFYHELFAGVLGMLGSTITSDTGALIQLVIWVAASLVLGITGHRLTGRLSIGVAVIAVSYYLMTALRNEPMHPEALISALLASMVCVVAFGSPRHPRGVLVAVGALASALVLTKINAGGFAVISIAFAAVMAGPALYRHALLRWAVAATFVLVGPAVMASSLNAAWVRSYAALAALSAAALVIVTVPARPAADPTDESAQWPKWLIAGFIGLALPVLVILLALGSTPGALIEYTIILPARRQAVALTIPLILSSTAIWWSLGSVVVAGAVRRRRGAETRAAQGPPSPWKGMLRMLVGVAILASLVSQFPLNIYPSAAFALAMPLAWVAALPSRRDRVGSHERLVRLLVPALAVLQGLLAYPVAGSQVYLGSILFALCGAMCHGDGWSELTAWSARRVRAAAFVPAALSALLTVLALGAVWHDIIQPTRAYRATYRASLALSIPGATRFHLLPAQDRVFETMVATLKSHCGTLLSLPGLYSFNLWSGLPTPSPQTGEQPWWYLLSDSQQRQIVAQAKQALGLCAIRDDPLALYQGAPPPRTPLVAFLDDDFKPIASYPPYVVEIRR